MTGSFVVPASTQARQSAASDPAVSAFVDAHAGSGKTHVLARRVVRLLLRGTPPGRLLCLTYTKAAAANMANRVLKTLADWSTLPDDALDAALVATDGGTASPERRAHARRLFAAALEVPGGLKVQTIHAFCDRVLHQFPFEAGVPAGFSVLDERTARDLLADARTAVLVEASADPGSPLGQALATAVACASDDGLATALDEAVAARDKVAAFRAAGDPAAMLGTALGLPPQATRAGIEAEMLASPHLPPARWAEFAARLGACDKATEQKLAARLAAAAAAPPDTRLAAWLAVFRTAAGEARKPGSFLTKGFREDEPALADALLDELDRIGLLVLRRAAAVARDGTLALLALAEAVIARYEATKARRALLDFDDLVEKTRTLFEAVPATWVLYKLDRGIDHVLIDEAQDTSPAQWAVVQALTAEFFAGRGAREHVARTVFAVGDAKQSIFGFQGAAPAMFGAMRRHFRAEVEGAGLRFEPLTLDTSFRAAQPVLDAVDRVFARPEASGGLGLDGAELKHDSVREGAPGVVEIWPMLEPAPKPPVEDWTLPVDSTPRTSPLVQLARDIAASVASWVADGTRRLADGRPITAGDVLVLVRRRGALFEAILAALKARGLPVAGADRLVLAEHVAVEDLLALADALLTEADDLALATVLKSPLFGFDDDDLAALCPGRPGTLRAALAASAAPRHRAAAATLARWTNEARDLRPFDFYARVLGRDGGRRRLIARLGPEAADPIDEFLSLALAYESTTLPTLHGYVADLRRDGAEVKRDMAVAASAVRVMTVHGAKGLEAPVVILADTVGRPEGDKPPRLLPLPGGALLWAPRKQENEPPVLVEARKSCAEEAADEYRRLLYVALTRAADVLVVAGARGERAAPEGCWHALVSAALPDAIEEPADGRPGTVRRWRRWPEPVPAQAAVPADNILISKDKEAWMEHPAALAGGAAALAPSRLAARAGPDTAARERARARGRLVHRLLQVLPAAAPARRAEIGNIILRRAASALDFDGRMALLDEVLALIADPALAPLLAPGSRAEAPIAGRLRLAGGLVRPVAGRIDRLVVGPEAVRFADFKTDAVAPAAMAAVPAAHIDQLAVYRAVLREIFPDKAVEAILVYTAGPRLLAVPAALLDAALARITSA